LHLDVIAEALLLDWYSKVVMTVIAIALSIIAIRGPLASSSATAQADACGSIIDPCYIRARDPIPVEAESPISVRIRD
jgi:hypothetical protein